MIARLLLYLFTLLPALAFADSASTVPSTSSSLSFTPPGTDYSVIFLSNLFGVVDGVLHGTGSQIMGSMFAVFNAAVLALGGIVVMYTLIVGTMNTAHEGQMLGQKWSSIYIPIRSTIGLSFLIPKASGYCLMQTFTMWVVVQGVGAADKIWNAALNYLNEGGVFVQAQMSNNSTTTSSQNSALVALAKGAGTILSGEVCMAGLKQLLQNQRATYLANSQPGINSGPCSQANLANSSTSADVVYFCNNEVPDFIGTVNAVDFANIGFVSACSTSYSATASNPPYKLPMPNFKTAPYSNLNGLCGYIQWNDFNPDLTSSTTLSCSDIDTTRQARPTAVQQMYSDLTPVAEQIIANDPQITTTATTTDEYASPIALNQFGVPLLTTGANASYCTSPSSECGNWGPDLTQTNQSMIFTGFELQNTLNDYNGIMLAPLNLINDYQNAGNANTARNFIANAQASGWIMAGSYFFNLVYMNGLVTSQSNTLDSTSGLDSYVFNQNGYPFVFTAPSAGVACTSTICNFFNGDPGPVNTLANLYDGSSLGLTSSTHNNSTTSAVNVDTSAVAYSDKFSATVFGFITNEAMVHLPGQPGLTTPQFNMNFNIQPGQTLLKFPSRRFGGFFGPLESVLYNDMFLSIVNIFISFIVSVFSLAIQAFLYVPLSALMIIFDNGVQQLQTTMVHPIIALAYMGSAFINGSVEIWLNLITFTVIFVAIGGVGWLIMVMLMLPFLCSWLGIMTSVGFVDAYYVPFVPYMIFTFGSIAWLMAVIETTIAGPIIALGITHPEGHDALGKAEQAVMILVNVFLRPSMMIIGYVAAISLSYVTVFILNSGFSNVMGFLLPSANSAGQTFSNLGNNLGETGSTMASPYYNWTAIYASFFCLVTYTSLYATVVQKSFTLISGVPDKILRWIGSQGESYGQDTAQWAEDAKGQTKEAGEATGKSSMKVGGSVMGLVESAAVGANKGTTGGSASAT